METEIFYLNCRYCGAKMPINIDCCTHCGGPNQPEPLPWYKSIGLRIKSSILSKSKSVWADRLASLMPLHFLVALVQLSYILFARPSLGSNNLTSGIAAGISILFILAFYPDWYESSPEVRKNNGLLYFCIVIVYIFILSNFTHLLYQ